MTMDVEAARPRAFALRLLPQEQSGPTLLRAVPELIPGPRCSILLP